MSSKDPKYDPEYDITLAEYSNRPRALNYDAETWSDILHHDEIDERFEELLTTLVRKSDGRHEALQLSQKVGGFDFELEALVDQSSNSTGSVATAQPEVFCPIKIRREGGVITVGPDYRFGAI